MEITLDPVCQQRASGTSGDTESQGSNADFMSLLLSLAAPQQAGVPALESPDMSYEAQLTDREDEPNTDQSDATPPISVGDLARGSALNATAADDEVEQISLAGDFLPIDSYAAHSEKEGRVDSNRRIESAFDDANAETKRPGESLLSASIRPEYMQGRDTAAVSDSLHEPFLTPAADPRVVTTAAEPDTSFEVRADVGSAGGERQGTATKADGTDVLATFARSFENVSIGDTVAPGEPAAARPVPAAEIARAAAGEIVREVSLLKNGDAATLTIRLTPPDLGSLRVSVRREAGILTTELHGRNELVRSLLESSLPSLREHLASAGIEVSRFTVSAGPDFGQFADRQPRNWQSGRSTSAHAYVRAADDTESYATTAPGGLPAGWDWLA